jgi:hypothetical protein
MNWEVISMWNEQKRARFEQLRQGSKEGRLTALEQAELAQLVKELETAEATYLTPATERLRQEREKIESRNRVLADLAQRKGALVTRLREVLNTSRAERQAIDGELAAVLAREIEFIGQVTDARK